MHSPFTYTADELEHLQGPLIFKSHPLHGKSSLQGESFPFGVISVPLNDGVFELRLTRRLPPSLLEPYNVQPGSRYDNTHLVGLARRMAAVNDMYKALCVALPAITESNPELASIFHTILARANDEQ